MSSGSRGPTPEEIEELAEQVREDGLEALAEYLEAGAETVRETETADG